MIKLFATFLMSSILIACAGTSYMNDYLVAIEGQLSTVRFEHAEYGLLSAHQAPLEAELIRCNESVFKAHSIALGSAEVSDVALLERVNADYHAFLLESIMLNGSGAKEALRALYMKTGANSEHAELRRNAFGYTAGLEEPLEKLTHLILQRNKCMALSGWHFKRSGR